MKKANELDFLNKFDSGYQFNEEELEYLTWEIDVIDEIGEGGDKWARSMRTIFKIGNRYFAIDWNEEFSEIQEGYFYKQVIEVLPHEEIITKTTYMPICRNGGTNK